MGPTFRTTCTEQVCAYLLHVVIPSALAQYMNNVMSRCCSKSCPHRALCTSLQVDPTSLSLNFKCDIPAAILLKSSGSPVYSSLSSSDNYNPLHNYCQRQSQHTVTIADNTAVNRMYCWLKYCAPIASARMISETPLKRMGLFYMDTSVHGFCFFKLFPTGCVGLIRQVPPSHHRYRCLLLHGHRYQTP